MKSPSVTLAGLAVYAGLSVLISGAFLLGTLRGDYSWVARLGGAGWVFLLSMIVLMPVVIPWMKKRSK